jgi:competence protein ComEC
LRPSAPSADPTAFSRRRPLFWAALAFCAGIAAGDACAASLQFAALLCGAAVAIAALLLWLRRKQRNPRAFLSRLLSAAALCAPAAAAGVLLLAWRSSLAEADSLAPFAERRDTMEEPDPRPGTLLRGTILEASASETGVFSRRERLTWTLALTEFGADGEPVRAESGRVRLTLSVPAPSAQLAALAEGDSVELRAWLTPLPEHTLPHGLDYGAFLRRRGIRCLGEPDPASVRILSGPPWWRLDFLLRRSSQHLARRIERLMPDAELEGRPPGSQGALLSALLFGRRERVDVSDRDAFNASGAAHLLAVSGLHLQFLAVALWWIAGRLGISRRRSAWLIVLFSCGYCLLTGAQPPILRATVMIVVYLSAALLWREPDPLSALGAAALLVLCVCPEDLFSAGFQLSLAAVLAILVLYPVLTVLWRTADDGDGLPATEAVLAAPLALRAGPRLALPGKPAVGQRFEALARQALLVSLAAWIGTAPIVAWHMGRFAALSLLVNLVAVPLSSVCMLSGLVALAGSLVCPWLGQVLAWPAWFFVALLQQINETAAALPGACLDVQPRPVLLLAFPAAALVVWGARDAIRGPRPATDAPSPDPLPQEERTGGPRRAAVWIAVCLPLALLAVPWGKMTTRPPGAPSLTVFDLPHGHAALVESPGGAALIDAGGGSAGPLAEALRRGGLRRLDLLVITADEHETLGGAVLLLQRIPARRVFLPRAVQCSPARRELEEFLARAGVPYGAAEGVALGSVALDFRNDGPPPDAPAASESALCVSVSWPGCRTVVAAARSGVALRRLLGAFGNTINREHVPAPVRVGRGDKSFRLRADVLIVKPPARGRWPAETADLMEASGCRVVVAVGRVGGPLCERRSGHPASVASVRQAGSLRIVAGGDDRPALSAFRGGWRVVE